MALSEYRRDITDFYTEQLQEKDQQIEALQRQVAEEKSSERQDKIESFMMTLADDIEYQERRIERGYDVEDRIRVRVAGYRELFEREGEQ